MTRRTFSQAILAGGLAAQTGRRPNVVFFCSDQHIGPVLGASVHPVVKTPHLDPLAAMGVNFSRPLLFDLRRDPGEFNNLAGRPETAAIQKELHATLTSLVEPDTVTRQAFQAQARYAKGVAR